MEEAAFLATTDLRMDHAPSAAIPVCNRNRFASALSVGSLLTKETNAHPMSVYESIHKIYKNIYKVILSSSRHKRSTSFAAQ